MVYWGRADSIPSIDKGRVPNIVEFKISGKCERFSRDFQEDFSRGKPF